MFYFAFSNLLLNWLADGLIRIRKSTLGETRWMPSVNAAAITSALGLNVTCRPTCREVVRAKAVDLSR
jgi:hypothetical protein